MKEKTPSSAPTLWSAILSHKEEERHVWCICYVTLSIRDISAEERDGVTVLMPCLLQDLNDTTRGARLYTRLIEPRENGEATFLQDQGKPFGLGMCEREQVAGKEGPREE